MDWDAWNSCLIAERLKYFCSLSYVYNQCVIPIIMYGSETWTLYRHHIKKLRTLQQRYLRFILNIKWTDYVTNDEVLERAKTEDIENILIRNRLRWLGHVVRMPDERPVKNLLYSELAEGTRKVGRPVLRFKDTMKDILKRGGVLDIWKSVATDRLEWRRLTSNTCQKIDNERKDENKKRRQKRHQRQKRN